MDADNVYQYYLTDEDMEELDTENDSELEEEEENIQELDFDRD